MWLESLLLYGGAAVCVLIGHWTIRPVRSTNPYGM